MYYSTIVDDIVYSSTSIMCEDVKIVFIIYCSSASATVDYIAYKERNRLAKLHPPHLLIYLTFYQPPSSPVLKALL